MRSVGVPGGGMFPYFYVPYPLVLSNQSGRVFPWGLYYLLKVQAKAPQAPKRPIWLQKSLFFTVISAFIFQRARAARGGYFSDDRAPRADDAGGAWPTVSCRLGRARFMNHFWEPFVFTLVKRGGPNPMVFNIFT